MSISTTPFLRLPQWTADEKPSFLAEINQAWASIDKGYGDLKTETESASTAAEAAQTAAENAQTAAGNASSAVLELQQTVSQNEADFIDTHYMKTTTLEFSNVQEGATLTGTIIANGFCAYIELGIKLTINPSQITDPIATITNMPYLHNNIKLLGPAVSAGTPVASTGGPTTAEVLLNQNNNIIFGHQSSWQNTAKTFSLFSTIPIFNTNISTLAKGVCENIPDGIFVNNA